MKTSHVESSVSTEPTSRGLAGLDTSTTPSRQEPCLQLWRSPVVIIGGADLSRGAVSLQIGRQNGALAIAAHQLRGTTSRRARKRGGRLSRARISSQVRTPGALRLVEWSRRPAAPGGSPRGVVGDGRRLVNAHGPA